MASSTSEAALKLEIARLKGAIDRHKSGNSLYPPRSRNHTYINPKYKPEASGRYLVRKNLPPKATYSGHQPSSRGRRGRPANRNMTLDNSRRPYQPKRMPKKHSDKPCPRFTTTGACSRGLTCMYQHDPAKIAICWNFLQGHCPNTAEACNLSHSPTPERTPLCMHFANNGRCNRDGCLFPHVHVGARRGVCREFAVLGYCARGLECDKQHIRECPDFAEQGTCTTKGCKLPHVIRANRNRIPTATTVPTHDDPGQTSAAHSNTVTAPAELDNDREVPSGDAQLGDEYISLTFHESESSDEEDDDVGEESDEMHDE